jgi:hypothetical protein
LSPCSNWMQDNMFLAVNLYPWELRFVFVVV